MGIKVGHYRGKNPFYNAKEFLCDYEADLANLPTDCGVGSTARVIETSKVYMLNSAGEWIKQSSPTGGGSTEGGGEGNLDPSDTYIYDGGLIV